MEKRIFKQLFPGVDEKYVERAFEKLNKNGCPEGEDLLTWFGCPSPEKYFRTTILQAYFS